MRVDGQIRGMRPDKSVLMSASAGSGKTHVLVGRMIHLLAAGLPPEALAAITFTEKAAAQMKDRLFGTLAGAAWEVMPFYSPLAGMLLRRNEGRRLLPGQKMICRMRNGFLN